MIVDRLRLLAYVALAAAGLLTGWQVRDWMADSDALEKIEQQERQRALAADIARQTMAAIASIRIEQKTVYQQATKEVIRDPIYLDCRVPVPGSRLLNQSRAGRRGADAAMPGDTRDPTIR